MSLIVVEGVDASGKSTLLENARIAIKKKYFLLLRHSCRPLIPADVHMFLHAAENMGIDTIVDRHPYISEPIYGPLLRGHNLIDDITTDENALRHLAKTVDRIIYCRPRRFKIVANLEKLPQLVGIKEKIEKLIDAYDQRMGILQRYVSVIPYDYELPRDLESMFFGDIQ